MPYSGPGADRRWEPEGGVRKHNERIHRESKEVDRYSNLPFTLSKPQKPKKHIDVVCDACGYCVRVPKNTVGMICLSCKKYSSVKAIEQEVV